MSQIKGHISQIIGPVIDVHFEVDGLEVGKVLPKIHEALTLKRANGEDLIIEVQQHIGEDTVRCVAMDNTDGLQRGLEVIPTGKPIVMPAGEQIKVECLMLLASLLMEWKALTWKVHIQYTVNHQSSQSYLQRKRCLLQVLR